MIVPRTSGVNLKKVEKTSNGLGSVKMLDSQGNLHPLLASTVKDLFNKFDVTANHLIDLKEFKGFLEILSNPHLPVIKDEKGYQEQILSKYNSTPQGITFRGFYEWWKAQIISEGEAAIWEWLMRLGYDKDLNSLRSRIFTITVQSRNLEVEGGSIECRIRDAIPTDIDSRVSELLLESRGQP